METMGKIHLKIRRKIDLEEEITLNGKIPAQIEDGTAMVKDNEGRMKYSD